MCTILNLSHRQIFLILIIRQGLYVYRDKVTFSPLFIKSSMMLSDILIDTHVNPLVLIVFQHLIKVMFAISSLLSSRLLYPDFILCYLK